MKKTSVIVSLFMAILAWTIVISSTEFAVKAEETRGVISVAFDDNYLNQYQYAFPLLEKYGITGTFYVRTDRIGMSGYMSSVQLQTLASHGNEIGSHSHTHTSFTLLSQAEIQNECSYSKQILESYGFNVTNFAYPNGLTNDYIDSIVSNYYQSARTAYVGPYVMGIPTNQFRVSGFSAETQDSSALSLLKEMVDNVYAANGWAIIFFHNIIPHVYTEPYTTSAEDFESFLNYTVSIGVQTLPVNQVVGNTLLSTNANLGTVSPASGMYSIGTVLNIQAFPPPALEGERYVWLGWTGSGVGSYTGTNNPFSIALNGPISQTATWRHEYKLTVLAETGNTSTSLYERWCEAGSVANIDAVSPVARQGERFTWNEWAGTGSGSYSGSSMTTSITINTPITQVARWDAQYFVNVTSVFGTTEGTGWYNSGTTAYATIDMSTANTTSDSRYSFKGWSEDASGTGTTSDEMIVEKPLTAVASWKKQYLVVIDQTGLPNDFDVRVVVNSTTHALPLSVWVNEGDNLQYAFPDRYEAGFTGNYVLTSPIGPSSHIVRTPVGMTAQYELQYSAGSFAVIILPLILIFIIASVLLLRKRKSTP